MAAEGEWMGSSELATLCADYFAGRMAADPFAATVYGVPGHDAEVPDPSRKADSRRRAELDAAAARLTTIARDPLPETDQVTLDVLRRAITDELGQLAHPLHEVSVSATIVGDLSEVLAVVPSVALTDARRAEDYLRRLSGLGDYFDAKLERHRQAAAEGRYPTARGVSAAIAQLDGLLVTDIAADPFLRPDLPSDVDGPKWCGRAAELLREVVRPALRRTRVVLAEEFLSVGRDDTRAGVCHIPDGPAGYADAVAAHTTTSLTAEEIHQLGLDMFARLRAEFAELGGRALGTSDVDEVIARLRDDSALRFCTAAEIVDTVTGALHRAGEALPGWFRVDDLARVAPCEVREMDPLEAEGGVLGYYLPPAADGSRAGLHAINTLHPELRPRFEYEALAFHESVPGHHVQIVLGQALRELPDFRRFSSFTAYVEGWALYTERLADEMGLYSADLTRLGAISFDAWRAARLVVDTGMHQLGWSRSDAVEFMLANTALAEKNIGNEVDRYIAVPGQALAYMLGRRRICELRSRAQQRLGAAFDIAEFHHQILGHGALPLDTLSEVVDRWLSGVRHG